MRIDKYLVKKNNCSRVKIHNLIKKGCVIVNKKQIFKASYDVSDNDKIEIKSIEEVNQIDINLQPSNQKLDIVYEDNYLLIINKPSGLLTHPTIHNEKNTLANILVNYLDPNVIKNTIRPGIVHRLDKDTSGLLIVAKTINVLRILQQQIKDKKIKRKYLAICHNNFKDKHIIINAPLSHAKNNSIKMVISNDNNAKEAITIVNVLKNLNNNLSLIECELKTGRTHQIRAHLAYINHPIFNDSLYGTIDGIKKYGQYLHAYKLSLIHPITKKKMFFEKQPDKNFMAKLKQNLKDIS